MTANKNAEYGYPFPGPQEISAGDVMRKLFFTSDDEWENFRTNGNFDYVVIGSSFCAMAFTQQMLKKNPKAKILILERGHYFLPVHFQNLPQAYSFALRDASETFHWTITKATHEGEYIKWQHGMNNFFGGRSLFWSGWCPEPTREEMVGWPDEVINAVHEYFPAAKQLLRVTPANKISDQGNQCIFGKLQDVLVEKLQSCLSMDCITRVEHAPLAVQPSNCRYGCQKYSVSGPLLDLLLATKYKTEKEEKQPLQIMLGCLVKKIVQKSGKAIALETSKGKFTLGDAKLILAMGTLPSTTLMLNSFPSVNFTMLSGIGNRFTAHFISFIIARIPFTGDIADASNELSSLRELFREKSLEMAAVYIAGKDLVSKQQFHIQLTAIIDKAPEQNIYDIMRYLPDVLAAPSLEQRRTSKDPLHIVFACACVGQLDHNNEDNWFRLNNDVDITSNATLQVVANEKDNALWNTMEQSTFEMLENFLDSGNQLEYWHSNTWKTGRPSADLIRVSSLVHEASTMWIGEDQSAPVDLDYRFRGVDNVYLTGGALWPTGASWNPTCAMSALSMHLADKLNKNV